jgi:hypothetical protein
MRAEAAGHAAPPPQTIMNGHICGPPGVIEVWVDAGSGTISVVTSAMLPQSAISQTRQR